MAEDTRDTRDWRPVPDPTLLTTEQLLREIAQVNVRLDAEIAHLAAINDEKFRGVRAQFELVERQRVEQKLDTNTAVAAALTAQKEAAREQTLAAEKAIAKSEASTAKAIEGVAASLDDVKVRVTVIESLRQGSDNAFTAIYVLAGLLIAVSGLAFSVYISTR